MSLGKLTKTSISGSSTPTRTSPFFPLTFLLLLGYHISHLLFYLCLSLTLTLLFLHSAFLQHPTAILQLDPLLFHAFTLHVDSSALVAELEFALAGHMVTAFILLHPEFALGALFKLLAFDEGHEFLIIFTRGCTDLVFFAGHILMPLNAAVQAIFLLALEALETFCIVFLVEEHVAAVGSRTPGDRITVLLSISFESVLLIFLHEVARENGSQIRFSCFCLAALCGTTQRKGLVGDATSEIFSQAVLVEYVTTFERLHFCIEQVHVADQAHHLFLLPSCAFLVELLLHSSSHLNVLSLSPPSILFAPNYAFLGAYPVITQQILQLHSAIVIEFCQAYRG